MLFFCVVRVCGRAICDGVDKSLFDVADDLDDLDFDDEDEDEDEDEGEGEGS